MKRGKGLDLANPKGLPLYQRAKIGLPTELVGNTGSRVARSVGMPIFPSALSQGVGGELALVKGLAITRSFGVFPPSLEL